MSEESKRVLELEPRLTWRNTKYYPPAMALAPEQADELATLAPQLARQVEALEARIDCLNKAYEILSPAVGIAKLRIKEGRHEKALEALETYSTKLDHLERPPK